MPEGENSIFQVKVAKQGDIIQVPGCLILVTRKSAISQHGSAGSAGKRTNGSVFATSVCNSFPPLQSGRDGALPPGSKGSQVG